MDAALYEKLLEELRSDLTQTAPVLEELESVESFLQRRMGSVNDKASYQKVLDDIAADISHQNQSFEELKRIDRFVSSKLGQPSFSPEMAPRAAKPQPEKAAGFPPPKKPPAKPAEDTKAEKPQPSLATLSGDSSGMTIEFGPDGFPVHSAGSAKERAESRDGKTPVGEGTGMDGATINFGPDGFPLDFPRPNPKK